MGLILPGNSKMEERKHRPQMVEETVKIGTNHLMTTLHLAAILATPVI